MIKTLFELKPISLSYSKNVILVTIIVKINANIHINDVNFNHIIEHALSCTLEEDGENVSNCVGLRFGMID